MNASAALRASFYGADSPLGLSPGDLRSTRRHTMGADVEALRKRRTLVPVNYPDYIAQCRQVKETASEESIFAVKEELPGPPSVRDQIKRMLYIWPYRDANWLLAVVFTFGSISFTVGAFFGLLPLVAPSTAFPGEVEVATPVTTLLGAIPFLIGGTIGLVAGWNADKGEFEPVEFKTEDGVTKTYKPALLGSSSWTWVPSVADLKVILRTVPFQANLIQFTGGLVFSVAIVGGWPGVLAPDDVTGFQLFLYGPLAVGGTMFLFANLALTIWLQDPWYKPKFDSASWQASFWSSIGAVNFAISGFSLLVGDAPTSTIATFIGSWTFLIGSIISWYDLMAFHPDSWAA
ncbi:hypothetical protein F4779DRAFT_230361 [Xylariaceae sp. FL0662B]|nr:hypothetical protein F4779DRAFT_230361 [Xylariaceae sp. FL0662B]